jgi:hypothetical protein
MFLILLIIYRNKKHISAIPCPLVLPPQFNANRSRCNEISANGHANPATSGGRLRAQMVRQHMAAIRWDKNFQLTCEFEIAPLNWVEKFYKTQYYGKNFINNKNNFFINKIHWVSIKILRRNKSVYCEIR